MRLSKGNTKIGVMPNVSLTPIKSCGECAKICGGHCYAMKFYRLYPAVKETWDHNLQHATADLAGFFRDLEATLEAMSDKPFFRWHVGGDILSREYFSLMRRVAFDFSRTRFLCFTKQYDIVNEQAQRLIPKNLTIIFSAWPGIRMCNPHKFPVAFMQDGQETRLTGTEIECPGYCQSCGMCWDIRKLSRNVVFLRH